MRCLKNNYQLERDDDLEDLIQSHINGGEVNSLPYGNSGYVW